MQPAGAVESGLRVRGWGGLCWSLQIGLSLGQRRAAEGAGLV